MINGHNRHLSSSISCVYFYCTYSFRHRFIICFLFCLVEIVTRCKRYCSFHIFPLVVKHLQDSPMNCACVVPWKRVRQCHSTPRAGFLIIKGREQHDFHMILIICSLAPTFTCFRITHPSRPTKLRMMLIAGNYLKQK